MVGSTISHYRVLEKVGSGGMGVVYKAEDLNLGRVVALKTLITESPDLRVRLLAEAQAAASLSHPNICTVYEIDREHLLLAMEFVEGETVAQKLRSGPLPIAKALDIATQASEGLHAAHQRGITHRDVKSANLMVTREGQVKVMDFGLALTDDATRITETGVVTGTPSYMAPEQAAGKTVDRRSDIWALAVVLYEMVSGRTPFSGGSPAAIVHALLHDSPAPLTSLRADVPLELDRILAKALRKDPTERYQRLDDFIVDLKSLSASVSSPPLTSRRRRRESGPTKRHVYVGTAAALVVAALVWQVSRIRAPQQQSTPAVAVLPLADLSLAAQNSYISDGLTDALITELGSVANLRVTSS
jgi:serine/threonine protein kinase